MHPRRAPTSVILPTDRQASANGARHRRPSPFSSPESRAPWRSPVMPTQMVTPAQTHAPVQKAPRSDHEKKVEELRKHLLAQRQKRLAGHPEHKGRKKGIDWTRIVFWVAIVAAIIIVWKLLDIPSLVLDLLRRNPTVWALYKVVAAEVEARSLLGLLYASFFGSLFFISLPVEVIFLYYLGLNYYFIQVMTIVLLGNIVGMVLNYGCGWLIGERVVQFFMRKSYPKFKAKINRAGVFIILIGNIIPFPIEPFAVFLGAVRYPFRKFIAYTIIGKVVKFVLLWLAYTYFVKYAAPYLSGISVDIFIQAIRDIFVFW